MWYVWLGLVCLAGMVWVIGLSVYYNQALICEYYPIEDAELPSEFDGCKIVLLTDLHENQYGKCNSTLLKKIEEETPDYVMIAGDMLVKSDTFYAENTLALLEAIVKKCPVLYAPGNHEEYLERREETCLEYKEFVKRIKQMGVIYLANETFSLKRKNATIRVGGLHLQKDYFAKFYENVKFDQSNVEDLLGKKQREYTILLAHTPVYFEEYAKWGANLVCSGHVHGGIVILPFLGGVISTTYELFPKYDHGQFQIGNTKMVLSRGLGVHTIKLRLFNKPEISVIQLRKR